MPLDNIRKIRDAEIYGGKGERSDGIPVAPFRVFVAGEWHWCRQVGETSAHGVRVRDLVDVGVPVTLTQRLSIVGLTLCVGYTQADLLAYYTQGGLAAKAVGFSIGCMCGLVIVAGALIGKAKR